MEFTSWYIGDLYETVVALANMSSSMAGSVINLLFLFVVFLLLFRAFISFMHRKFGSAGISLLYVFLLGFLFLGSGSYYINYVNITGFTKDDSARLDQTAPSDSYQYAKVSGETQNGTVKIPANRDIQDANTIRYRLDNIPHVYVIPAFMDEVAVSLATAAGIGRTGDYYTLAVARNPNVVFTMAANQMLYDYVKGKDGYALCEFAQKFSRCFRKHDSLRMLGACQELGQHSDYKLSPITEEICDDMVRQYGNHMQGFLDLTIKKYANTNDTYKAIYQSYSQMAQQLKNSDYKGLPPPVKEQLEKSIDNSLEIAESIVRKADDNGEIARALSDSWFLSHFAQYLGMAFKEFLASLGKSWLIQTLLVQNEIVVFLSFFLLPLVVLVTFLTNNFKYLTEYAFGYLLLKLQLPLWVIGHYLVTGHVFNNLLASPSINGFLLGLIQSGEINNSDILVNTITAGVTSLGIGSLFLFGKSAAGGIQQGVAAGGEIVKGAMEIGAMALQAGMAIATAGTSLAGQAGIAASGAAKLAGSAGSAAGSAVGSGVGKAIQSMASAKTFSQFVGGATQLATEGIKALGQKVIQRNFTKHPTTKLADGQGNFITFNNKTGSIQSIDASDKESFNKFTDALKRSGYKVKTGENRATNEHFLIAEDVHGRQSRFVGKNGKFVFDRNGSDKEIHIDTITGGREMKEVK